MLRFTASVVLLILLAVMPLQAFSFGPDLEVSFDFGTEIIDGFTQYELVFLWDQIGDYRIYAHSRLRYPFTSNLVGGSIKVGAKDFSLAFGYWDQYRSTGSTKMQDWDWYTDTDQNNELMIYGITDPSPSIYYWQLDFGYDIKFSNFSLGPFFRYSKYHSEFVMEGLYQIKYYDLVHPIPVELEEPIEITRDGQVLYYEQDLHLPFFGINANVWALANTIEVYTSLGFSPLVMVDDHDEHTIRRDSLEAWNEGTGGTAIMLEVGVKVGLFELVNLNFGFIYNDYDINTSGRQFTYLLDDSGDLVEDENGDLIEQFASGIDTQVSGVMRNFRVTISYIFF